MTGPEEPPLPYWRVIFTYAIDPDRAQELTGLLGRLADCIDDEHDFSTEIHTFGLVVKLTVHVQAEAMVRALDVADSVIRRYGILDAEPFTARVSVLSGGLGTLP